MFKRLINWVHSWGGPLGTSSGQQLGIPVEPAFDGVPLTSAEKALQISAVYACIELLANTMSTFPIFLYEGTKDKGRVPARKDQRFTLLHDQPNAWMTPSEFVSVMVMNRLMKGNAYAAIARDILGRPMALIPLSASQMQVMHDESGTMYVYYQDGDIYVYAEQNIIHWKGLGNGYTGLEKMFFMQASAAEVINAQSNATSLFGKGSKATGILMTDAVLDDKQIRAVQNRFGVMASSNSGLFLVDRGFKFQPMSLSPVETQLLESRKYGVEEICRWFGVPPILIGASGATTWGTGISEIVSGFHKFTLAPLCTQFQQALARKLIPLEDRNKYTIEMKIDALLRSSPQERAAYYSTLAQNGMMTRNEVRGLENLPPQEGGDELTAQSNLLPLTKLGTVPLTSSPPDGSPVRQ